MAGKILRFPIIMALKMAISNILETNILYQYESPGREGRWG